MVEKYKTQTKNKMINHFRESTKMEEGLIISALLPKK